MNSSNRLSNATIKTIILVAIQLVIFIIVFIISNHMNLALKKNASTPSFSVAIVLNIGALWISKYTQIIDNLFHCIFDRKTAFFVANDIEDESGWDTLIRVLVYIVLVLLNVLEVMLAIQPYFDMLNMFR